MKKTSIAICTLICSTFLFAASQMDATQLTDTELLALTGGGTVCYTCSSGPITINIHTGDVTCESGSVTVSPGPYK